MLEIIITSILAFAATNIDDLFLLTLFFGDTRYRASHIIVGQLLGIGILIVLSLGGSLIGELIKPSYVSWLGLFPIYLGVKQYINLFRKKDDAAQPVLKSGNIEFNPAIPEHDDAIKQLGFGTVIKVLLWFNNPFWKKHLRESQPSRIYGGDLSGMRKLRPARPPWGTSISRRTVSGIMTGITPVRSPANATTGWKTFRTSKEMFEESRPANGGMAIFANIMSGGSGICLRPPAAKMESSTTGGSM